MQHITAWLIIIQILIYVQIIYTEYIFILKFCVLFEVLEQIKGFLFIMKFIFLSA